MEDDYIQNVCEHRIQDWLVMSEVTVCANCGANISTGAIMPVLSLPSTREQLSLF